MNYFGRVNFNTRACFNFTVLKYNNIVYRSSHFFFARRLKLVPGIVIMNNAILFEIPIYNLFLTDDPSKWVINLFS